MRATPQVTVLTGIILGVLLLLSTHECSAFTFQSPSSRSLRNSGCPTILSGTKESNNEKDHNVDAFSSLTDSSRRRLFRDSLAAAAITAASFIPSSATATMTTGNTAARKTVNYLVPTPPLVAEEYWPLGKVAFSLLPLAGTSTRRATVEECVVPNTIWTHDQIQGIVNVNVPVRQTVVKLSSTGGGGLFIHNPVAPTPRLLGMMQTLIDLHGPVKHIVLGTVALEHKATFGAFAANYPNATVWIQPGQWSFPAGVPIEFNGLPQRGPRLREIPVPGRPATKPQYEYQAKKNPVPEWTTDFEYQVLGPFSFQSVGGFSETAFFHKPTKSLLVTDTVVSVTADAPPIIQEDPRALLYHARDSAAEIIPQDTRAVRQKGWRRMVQFGLVFFPSQIDVPSVSQALEDARHVPVELRNLGDDAIPFGTLYPWSWRGDSDQRNFDAISDKGRLFCPPILTKLILDREPVATLAWVDTVTKRWPDMRRVIPCHLNNNVRVKNSKEFYQAFEPLRGRPGNPRSQRALGEDLALLQKASDLLTATGVVAPSLVCDGEPARQRGRFAR